MVKCRDKDLDNIYALLLGIKIPTGWVYRNCHAECSALLLSYSPQ
jgi:hypothetical protein